MMKIEFSNTRVYDHGRWSSTFSDNAKKQGKPVQLGSQLGIPGLAGLVVTRFANETRYLLFTPNCIGDDVLL